MRHNVQNSIVKRIIAYMGFLLFALLIIIFSIIMYISSQAVNVPELKIPGDLVADYLSVSEKHALPWGYLAAIDEVENNYQNVTQMDITNRADEILKLIGNTDVMTDESVKQAIRQLYNEHEASKIITIADAYQFAAASLDDHNHFPFPQVVREQVTYTDTWGASRSFGGNRKHEGTDLMADSGLPLVAVSDGIVIRKGWNRLGGWRVLILDTSNPQLSYYYAHLSKYAEGLRTGQKVSKGDVIGYVGDSGYGSEGTTGQFPPHLHFGIYVHHKWLPFNSRAINPYPFLRAWEENFSER